jgi:tetratricopeptide (TPR) repeat protein
MLHCVVDFNMQINAIALTAVTIMALISAHLRFATDRFWRNPGVGGRLLLTVLAVSVAGFLGIYEVRGAREYRILAQAARLQRDSAKADEWLALMKRAHAVEPKNFETVLQIGEALARRSFEAYTGSRQLAEEGVDWFEIGMRLNPYDSGNHIGAGRCLDWLGRPEEAERHFKTALELDPLGCFTVASMGWHFFYVKQYAEAKKWFEKGRELSFYSLHGRDLQILTTQHLELVEKFIKGTPP